MNSYVPLPMAAFVDNHFFHLEHQADSVEPLADSVPVEEFRHKADALLGRVRVAAPWPPVRTARIALVLCFVPTITGILNKLS